VIAVLGAGPHGRQLAALHWGSELFDDHLDGFRSCQEGADQWPYVVGAAWPKVRRQIAESVCGVAWRDGNVKFPGAQIGIDVEAGQHVHVEFNAVISHGCRLGSFITVCPGAVLCGEVTVEDDVFIGANATVLHGGLTIGRGALIGAGAVVTRDVKPGDVVRGVPARVPTGVLREVPL